MACGFFLVRGPNFFICVLEKKFQLRGEAFRSYGVVTINCGCESELILDRRNNKYFMLSF